MDQLGWKYASAGSMKSTSVAERLTLSVPPDFAVDDVDEGLLAAGDAKPAATRRVTRTASMPTESQSLLCMRLLSFRYLRDHGTTRSRDDLRPGSKTLARSVWLVRGTRVEGVPEAVSEQVEGERRQQHGDARPDHQPRDGQV